jgi:hypothetical protein
MKWLPAVAIAIIIIALVVIGQMFFAIRALEGEEKELYGQVNSLGAQYDALQQQMARLVKLPKPQLVTYAEAQMDFARFVDELRKAGVGVTDITLPRAAERKESATLGEEVGATPVPKGFEEVVGSVKVGETGSFDGILSLLTSLQENPRLLRLSTIEGRSGRETGIYVFTIEAVYAVATQGGG